jgi:hypothetical protein
LPAGKRGKNTRLRDARGKAVWKRPKVRAFDQHGCIVFEARHTASHSFPAEGILAIYA